MFPMIPAGAAAHGHDHRAAEGEARTKPEGQHLACPSPRRLPPPRRRWPRRPCTPSRSRPQQAGRPGPGGAGVLATRLQHREPGRQRGRHERRVLAHDDHLQRRSRDPRADHQAAHEADRRRPCDRSHRATPCYETEIALVKVASQGRGADRDPPDRGALQRQGRRLRPGVADPAGLRRQRQAGRVHRAAAAIRHRRARPLGQDPDDARPRDDVVGPVDWLGTLRGFRTSRDGLRRQSRLRPTRYPRTLRGFRTSRDGLRRQSRLRPTRYPTGCVPSGRLSMGDGGTRAV